MRSPTPNGKPVHLSHLHLLALHGRGALHRTRLSQSPYGQWLYMEATIHQVCLIFLSLDGAHLCSEGLHHDVLYTTNQTIRVQPGLALSQGTSHPGSTPCSSRSVFYLIVASQFIQPHNSHEYTIPNHVYKA